MHHLPKRWLVAAIIALVWLTTVSSWAADDAPIFNRIKLGLTNRSTGNLPQFTSALNSKSFTETPGEGYLLVGFQCVTGHAFNTDVVGSVQPIFRHADGSETSGEVHGVPAITPDSKPSTTRVVAKPGYAVGGLTIHMGALMDGFSVHFMRVEGAALNPRDTYDSDWIGGPMGNPMPPVATRGAPVIGIQGIVTPFGMPIFGLVLADRQGVDFTAGAGPGFSSGPPSTMGFNAEPKPSDLAPARPPGPNFSPGPPVAPAVGPTSAEPLKAASGPVAAPVSVAPPVATVDPAPKSVFSGAISGAIAGGVGGILVALLIVALRFTARAPVKIDPETGGVVAEFSRNLCKMMLGFSLFTPLVLTITMICLPPPNLPGMVIVLVVILFFSALGSAICWGLFNTRAVATADRLIVESAWSKRRSLRWSEITEVVYSKSGPGLEFRGAHGKPLRVLAFLAGLKPLTTVMRQKLPPEKYQSAAQFLARVDALDGGAALPIFGAAPPKKPVPKSA